MVAVDFPEIYRDGKVCIELTQKNISQLLNGKILNGFKVQLRIEAKDGTN